MVMALPASFLSEDQFTCSICLDVFNNPVSTPCGHSFCQSCISSYWTRDAKSYQCPLCNESFRKRPELHINRTLKEITEQFKQVVERGREHPAPSQHDQQHCPALLSPMRPGDMPEGVFAEMMTRFQKLSHQGQNTEHHNPPPPYSPLRRYTLSGPSDSPSDLPQCPVHWRGLEFFCRTDNTCVCKVCVDSAEHRGHNITSAKREWNIKKSHIGIAEVELKDLICARERKVEEINTSIQEIKAAAERETTAAICAFSQLMSTVERCQAEVLEVIEMNLRAAAHKAQSWLRELEEEIAVLKKRSATLSQLATTADYVFFLKMFPALSAPPQAKDWSGFSLSTPLTSGIILRSVTQMMEPIQEDIQKLPEVCQHSLSEQSITRINTKVRRVQEYAANITLDPSTAHPRLIISGDGKLVHCGDRHQSLPDNPERFDRVVCVLAHQGFSSGRHYWEVEVGGKTDWDLGVASRSVCRKGKITVSPAHGYWFLSLRDGSDYAFRSEPSTSLTVDVKPSRIGIYVDYDKGLVSFYNVEARLLIYTFTAGFTGIIHPFFSPCTNKSGRNEAPLIICPVNE